MTVAKCDDGMCGVMKPPVSAWAPHCWQFLHVITMNYPKKPDEKLQQATVAFFRSLEYMLPCSECAMHYHAYLKKHPIELVEKNWEDLGKWVWKLHNKVNKRQGRPCISWPQACQKFVFKNDYAPKKKRSHVFLFIILIALIVALLFFLNRSVK